MPVGKSRAANGTVVKRGFKDCSLDWLCEFCSVEMVAALKEAKAATATVRKLKCMTQGECIGIMVSERKIKTMKLGLQGVVYKKK